MVDKNFFPLENLMSFRRPEELQKFIDSLNKDDFSWRNVGDDETNFPRLAISRSGVRAIIERITNAFDAILENEKEIRNKPEDEKILSPRESIEKWFDIRGGHISSLQDKERRKMAQESIELILDDSGIEKRPTVTVRDHGIGIHPEEFPKTVVGLGGSLKRGKKYLLGAYGWGGSQTFMWCNDALKKANIESLPLAIIVSRKNPKLLKEGQKDEVGWTVVRYRDNPNEKHGVFQYLVDSSKKVPTTSPKNLPKRFSYGTEVIHLAYDLEKFYGRMTLASYRLFQSLLFDPVLPFWLYDNRTEEGRTISGNLSRLSTDEKSFVEYQNTLNQNLNFGTVKIRYWVLRSKKDGYHIDSYIERPDAINTIFITLNGQQYGALSRQIIKDAGFSFLSDYMLFQVECDSLSDQVKKGIFPSTREDIREEYKDIFKNEIVTILQNDDELKKLEEIRKQESLMNRDEEGIKRVRRLLDKLITFNKIIQSAGKGKGEKKKEKPPYKHKEPPTKLTILPEKGALEFIPGEEKKVTIETNASNTLLVRDKNPGSIDLFFDNPKIKSSIRRGFLRDGKINFYIFIENDVEIGTKGKLTCKLEIPNVVKLEDSKNTEIVSSPPPLPSNYPPTIFEIMNQDNPLNIKRGKRSLVQILCDGPDGLLEQVENKTKLDILFLPDIGIKVIGKSDLARHKIRIFLQCPESVGVGKRTNISCKLSVDNQSSLSAERTCVIVQPPPAAGEEGKKEVEVPNYDIVEVQPDDDNWLKFQWDETDVGKFMKSGDALIFYISLGNKNYRSSLESKSLPTEIVSAFKEKYVSYVCFHLWLLYEDSTKKNQSLEHEEEELSRICQTVLLTLDQDPRFR